MGGNASVWAPGTSVQTPIINCTGTYAYTATSLDITAYYEGLEIIAIFDAPNRRSVANMSLNINELGTLDVVIPNINTGLNQYQNITKAPGTRYHPYDGAVRAGRAYKLMYSAGEWLLFNPSHPAAVSGYTGSNLFYCIDPVHGNNCGGFTYNTSYTLVDFIVLTSDMIAVPDVDITLNIEIAVGPQTPGAFTSYGRIYRNGIAVGTEHVTDTTITVPETITGWRQGDALQLFAKTSVGSNYSSISLFSGFSADATRAIIAYGTNAPGSVASAL